MSRELEEYSSSRTLELPPGYSIRPMHADPGDGQQMLLLTRADGSPVAGFEFSAIGPGPKAIYNAAWEDAEQHYVESRRQQGTD